LARDLEILRLVILSLYLRGKIFLELNNIDGAASSAAELRSIIESSFYRKHIRFYYNLTGLIEMKRENVQDAAKYFERAISLLHFQKTKGNNDHALFIEPLAYACYLQGEMEKAQEEYKKIINLTTGRVYYGDIYARSYYMLGKIHEQQGDTAKAIEHYEKFLDLWKDADPGLAEVEDARKRLAGLR
jgi:tetratricopeptide (TPR) repeat protein